LTGDRKRGLTVAMTRTTLLVACCLVLGCEEEAKPPTPTAPATATATAPATTAAMPTRPTSSAAAPASASGDAGAASCDVTVTPGESIGDKKLAGTTSVQVDADATKSYCVFGAKLTTKSTLAEVKPLAPKSCVQAALIGATHLNCDDEGVALTFAGPPALLSRITIYPKGAPAPAPAKSGSKPAASK
jgi:hypothetical protein